MINPKVEIAEADTNAVIYTVGTAEKWSARSFGIFNDTESEATVQILRNGLIHHTEIVPTCCMGYAPGIPNSLITDDVLSAKSNVAGVKVQADLGDLIVSSGGSVAWGDIGGKPSTFPPSTHNHDTLYSAIAHGHAMTDITGLQDALDALDTLIDGKASTSHGHAISDVTGLQTALDGKSATGHGHSIADTTGLQTALDGKLPTSHAGTNTHAQIDTALTRLANTSGSNTGDQDVSGKVDKSGSLTQITTRNHSDLSGVGTNIHAAIDTFISSKAAASGLASLDSSSKLVQAPVIGNGGIVHANLSAGTLALAFGTNTSVKVTPNATGSFTTTVPAAGVQGTLIVLTSGTSSYTMTFGTGFKSTGTLTTGTTSARYFIFQFVSDGTSMIEASRTVAIT